MRTDELKGFSPTTNNRGLEVFLSFLNFFEEGRRRRRRWILIFFFPSGWGNVLMAVSTVRYFEIDKSLSLPGKKPSTVWLTFGATQLLMATLNNNEVSTPLSQCCDWLFRILKTINGRWVSGDVGGIRRNGLGWKNCSTDQRASSSSSLSPPFEWVDLYS